MTTSSPMFGIEIPVAIGDMATTQAGAELKDTLACLGTSDPVRRSAG